MSGQQRGGRRPGATAGKGAKRPGAPGEPVEAVPNPRRIAIDALLRIEQDGAYANLLLPKLLGRSGLSERDRAFATQLVYGTVRNRRACDWFVERYALGDLDDTVRAALRLGTFQLRFLGTPAHAAVSATYSAPRASANTTCAPSWPYWAAQASLPLAFAGSM